MHEKMENHSNRLNCRHKETVFKIENIRMSNNLKEISELRDKPSINAHSDNIVANYWNGG